ncbi:MAG: hypothetical protein OSB19_08435 [Opitutaceae bacterium]|nr:hypothetical protein [Opitutaceae bacterium]
MNQRKPFITVPLRLRLPLCLSIAAIALSDCTSVPVYQQQYVSKDGMTFSDNPAETDRVNLISQIEPGSAVSGGAQAAGCTACR